MNKLNLNTVIPLVIVLSLVLLPYVALGTRLYFPPDSDEKVFLSFSDSKTFIEDISIIASIVSFFSLIVLFVIDIFFYLFKKKTLILKRAYIILTIIVFAGLLINTISLNYWKLGYNIDFLKRHLF